MSNPAVWQNRCVVTSVTGEPNDQSIVRPERLTIKVGSVEAGYGQDITFRMSPRADDVPQVGDELILTLRRPTVDRAADAADEPVVG